MRIIQGGGKEIQMKNKGKPDKHERLFAGLFYFSKDFKSGDSRAISTR
jgi:hypothetical protein